MPRRPRGRDRWAFVGSAEVEVGEHAAVGGLLDTSGGATGLRIPMTTLPHGIWSPSVPNRTPNEPSSCRVRKRAVAASISALPRRRVGVDLGADRGVDQFADRLGERFVDAAQPFDVLGGEVLHGEVEHP